MMGPFLKRVRVRNFKSLADVDLELNRFNVIIGANAAGKSNLVQIFKFLRDIREHGLDNAVSMQGGSKYIGNMRMPEQSTVIELETELPKGSRMRVPVERRLYSVGGRWRLEFKAGEGRDVEIIDDSWTFDILQSAKSAHGGGRDKRQPDPAGSRPKGTVEVTQKGGLLHFETDLGDDLQDAFDRHADELDAGKNGLLVESRILEHFFPRIFRFESIGTYDFDSRLAGTSTPVKGMPVLEDDGSNLAVVLKYILDDDGSSGELHALVSNILPFVKTIGVKDFVKSVMFTVAEKHLEEPLPSSLLSDGTVSVVALVVSLYFEEMPVVVVEEPERHMHPSLMAKAVEMMRDASERRQIIITTHSPELVRYAGLESLYAIKKGSDGYSEIGRPFTNKELVKFLENDMGVGEMHVQNLLEW